MWQRHIGISTLFGAPDAPAQLIKLCQTKHVGPMDDHGVGVRNINARFNDVGCQQQIKFTVGKVGHDLFKVTCAHLAMRHVKLDFRHKVFKFLGNPTQFVDPWADIENLAATMAFAQDGLAHDNRIVGRDIGSDSKTIDWRGCNDRQFLDPGQCQLQGSWNWCRGQGQNMHIRFQFLEPFLVLHAEMLFFINNQKSKVLEMYTGSQKGVGSTNNINMSAFDIVLDQFGILASDKTR